MLYCLDWRQLPMTIIPTDLALPSDQDAALAKAASQALAQAGDTALRVQVTGAGGEITTFDLPPVVARLLGDILKETAAGHAVMLLPFREEITTQQAAELLNVSRPYVVSMIERGQLPARMVGNQRRLPLKDVLAYRAENRAKRRATLDKLAALDQELGLFDLGVMPPRVPSPASGTPPEIVGVRDRVLEDDV
jgi:excisionase family DNA binding protein